MGNGGGGGRSTEREIWGAEKRRKEKRESSGFPTVERLENSTLRN